jgi:hypothetical protein
MAEAKLIPAYKAVSVVAKKGQCCEAVLEYVGKRFLASEVTTLPIDACDRYAQCQCRYKKWDDRRQDERRFGVAGMANQYFHGDEKRSQRRGRRKTD